jgi:hypothetical protein
MTQENRPGVSAVTLGLMVLTGCLTAVALHWKALPGLINRLGRQSSAVPDKPQDWQGTKLQEVSLSCLELQSQMSLLRGEWEEYQKLQRRSEERIRKQVQRARQEEGEDDPSWTELPPGSFPIHSAAAATPPPLEPSQQPNGEQPTLEQLLFQQKMARR